MLKRRIDFLWRDAGVTFTEKNWINYDENFSVRSNIDFKNGTIEIDALIPLHVSNPYERAKQKISDNMVTSFLKKGIEQKGILINQLKTSKGFYVTNKNLNHYIQSDLFPKIDKAPTSIIDNDGKKRLRFGKIIPYIRSFLTI